MRLLRYILIVAAFWAFQPSVKTVVERVSVDNYEVLKAYASHVYDHSPDADQEYIEFQSIIAFDGSPLTADGRDVKLLSLADLIQNGIYRVSHEWSLFGSAAAQSYYKPSVLFGSPQRNFLVVWAIGDSHMTKRNPDFTTYGPTPTAGTVYQWDVANSNLFMIGATDIKQSGAGTDWGSIFPQTGISINTATGRPVVFATCGTGGTNYSPRTGDSGNWSTGGTLYSAAKTTMDNCLTYMHRTEPDYVLVNLGVNDERGGTSMATIKSDATSLYDRIHTDYPNAIIIQVMYGRDNVSFNNQRATDLRNYIRAEALSRSYMYICASETGLAGAGYYDSDGIHLSQPGNNEVGKMVGQWFSNAAYTNEMSRAVISSHLAGTLNDTNKALVDAWFTTMSTSYDETEAFYNFRTSTGNHYLDWTLQYCGGNTGGATITANDCITSNGTSTYWTADININIALKMTTTDNYMGVKVKTNRSGASTGVRNAFGASVPSTASQWLIGQNNTPNVYYRDCDNTTSTNAATAVPNDSFLSVQRTGTTKQYAINGTVASSATVAVTGGINQPVYIGCSNSNGTAAAFIDADFGYAIFGKLTTSNMANVYSACENVYDNWNFIFLIPGLFAAGAARGRTRKLFEDTFKKAA